MYSAASMPRSFACSSSSPTDAVSGVGVGRARDGVEERADAVVAERDARRRLALVVAEVGVHLGAGHVARDVDAVGDAQPLVRLEAAARRRRRRSSRGPARRAGGRGRSRAGSRAPRRCSPSSSSTTWAPPRGAAWTPDRASRRGGAGRPRASRRRAEQLGRARDAPVVDAVAGMDERDRHAVAGVDLGQLDARSARRRGSGGLRQLARRCALARSSTAGRPRGPAGRGRGDAEPTAEDDRLGLRASSVADPHLAPARRARAEPRITVAPASSSARTWPVSSGQSSPSRLIM